jgi:hypothetical protein
MFINLLVLSITVIMVFFVILWLSFPQLRGSIEAPKYQIAEWDRDNERKSNRHSNANPPSELQEPRVC